MQIKVDSNFNIIEIARVNFVVKCQESIIFKDPDPAYKSFLKNNREHKTVDVKIDLQFNNMPNTEGLTKIFDSGQSWSLFQDSNNYYITLNPPVLTQPLVTIKINRNFTKATMYCSEDLTRINNGKTVFLNPLSYPLDQILLMYYLSQREGALIHAAGLCFHDRGYIFPGKSGAGKSTISRQLAGIDDYEFISDDRIIVRKFNKTFKAFGTPWPGEAGIAVNKSVDLSGIFFISQSSYNKIEEIKPQKALERLLPVVSIPWYDKEVMIKILDFCEDLISNVPVYELHFNPGNEIINVFQNFVSK
jgi:hypothetical protein